MFIYPPIASDVQATLSLAMSLNMLVEFGK